MNSGSLLQMTGLTAAPSKKKIRRGGRGRGANTPGASHHTALNQAYAAGDFAKAKTHALNLANALHGAVHVAPAGPLDADDGQTPAPPTPAAQSPDLVATQRAQLAKRLIGLRK